MANDAANGLMDGLLEPLLLLHAKTDGGYEIIASPAQVQRRFSLGDNCLPTRGRQSRAGQLFTDLPRDDVPLLLRPSNDRRCHFLQGAQNFGSSIHGGCRHGAHLLLASAAGSARQEVRNLACTTLALILAPRRPDRILLPRKKPITL